MDKLDTYKEFSGDISSFIHDFFQAKYFKSFSTFKQLRI